MKKRILQPEETEGLIPYILRKKEFPSRKKMKVEMIDFAKEFKKTKNKI